MTKSEQLFIERMAHYVAEGFNFDEAAKKVIEADAKVFNFMFGSTKEGETVKKASCVQTYYEIKSDEAVNNVFKENISGRVTEEIRRAVLSN